MSDVRNALNEACSVTVEEDMDRGHKEATPAVIAKPVMIEAWNSSSKSANSSKVPGTPSS